MADVTFKRLDRSFHFDNVSVGDDSVCRRKHFLFFFFLHDFFTVQKEFFVVQKEFFVVLE